MIFALKKNFLLVLFISTFITVISTNSFSQDDESHFSKIFNREKPYRILLPADYYTTQKKYPVIYYFHGNTGSHQLDIAGVE